MKKVLQDKRINLILMLLAFFSFVIYALIGLDNIGYSYEYGNGLYLYVNCLGVIFVPIVAGLFLILLPLTTLFYFGKLKYVRVHKFMSTVDFLGVFGVSLAQGILILCYSDNLNTRGVFLNIFLIFTCVFSMMSAILCFVQLCMMPRLVNEKEQKIIKSRESNNAIQKLRTLKQLLDEGAITEEEYNEKKQKYIDLL